MKRKSNFELLRIISMVMIIMHHLSYHGGININYSLIGLNEFFYFLFRVGGKIGVDIFVLITGYFMINKEKIKISKLLKLWLQIVFYSVGLYTLVVLFTSVKYNRLNFIHSFLPISYKSWWFATAYFILYLFIPYINILFNKMDKNNYKKLLVLCTVLWIIIPIFIKATYCLNDILWFIYLYGVGGYIKLYKDDIKSSYSKYLTISIFSMLFIVIISILIGILSVNHPKLKNYIYYFYTQNSIGIFIAAYTMFIAFKNINIKYNKFINIIASTTFGIYLIHDSNALRSIIWKKIFVISKWFNTDYFIIYSILITIIIFVVCSIIELLRIYILEKNYTKLLDKISNKLDSIKNKIVNSKILDKIF